MACMKPIKKAHSITWSISYYDHGVRKYLPVVYTLEAAIALKKKYDELFPKLKTWKHNPANRKAKLNPVLRQEKAPKVSLAHCCYRYHKIVGERNIVEQRDLQGRTVKYACCDECWRDFVLGEVYRKHTVDMPNTACVVDAVACDHRIPTHDGFISSQAG